MMLFICQYCGSERKTSNAKSNHEVYCNMNPNRKIPKGSPGKRNNISIECYSEQLCSYGCNQLAKYKNKSGKLMCNTSPHKCPEIRKKNSEGGKKSYLFRKRIDAKEQYKNLPAETKKRMNWNKGNYSADFSYDGKGSHKKVLIQERGHKCECCQNTSWQGNDIPLELEHIDGNNRNNLKNNLKLLCPNCHAFTEFYRGRNKNTGKSKVSDQQIIDLIYLGLNNRQILLNVGLAAKGASYNRVNCLRKLILDGRVAKLVETQGT